MANDEMKKNVGVPKRPSIYKRIGVVSIVVLALVTSILFGLFYAVIDHDFNLLVYNKSGTDIQVQSFQVNNEAGRLAGRQKFSRQDVTPKGTLWITDDSCPSTVEVKVEWTYDGVNKNGSCTISNVICGCAYEAFISKEGFFCSRDCIDLND